MVPGPQENGREEVPTCRRCNIKMVHLVHIDSFGDQPGLDAYECPNCRHVLSHLRENNP
jgi:hypothetical protein